MGCEQGGERLCRDQPFKDALEYAKRSGVAIYTIGLNVPVLATGIRSKLGSLAQETGGQTYYISKATDLDRAVLRVVGASESHLIVDACYSFYLAFERGPGGVARPALRRYDRNALASPLNRAPTGPS